jgi:antitoxin CptB
MNAARKRLIFRAWRRGFREIDLILGGFADRFAEAFTDEEAAAFEHLLQAPDPELYEWILGRAPAPAQYAGPMLKRLQAYGGGQP